MCFSCLRKMLRKRLVCCSWIYVGPLDRNEAGAAATVTSNVAWWGQNAWQNEECGLHMLALQKPWPIANSLRYNTDINTAAKFKETERATQPSLEQSSAAHAPALLTSVCRATKTRNRGHQNRTWRYSMISIILDHGAIECQFCFTYCCYAWLYCRTVI